MKSKQVLTKGENFQTRIWALALIIKRWNIFLKTLGEKLSAQMPRPQFSSGHKKPIGREAYCPDAQILDHFFQDLQNAEHKKIWLGIGHLGTSLDYQ